MAAAVVAIGLMSGTSMDGIDAALLITDGRRILDFGPALTRPYDAAFRERLRAVLGDRPAGDMAAAERDLTRRHAGAVRALLGEWGGRRPEVIGFHGHTVLHRPAARLTRQLGDGARLARDTGLTVVSDFRGRDVAAGGEGAPLAPLFHAALAAGLDKPLAVLNVGGVANVTWIGGDDDAVWAFDTGPGNALIDDWARLKTGRPMDEDGRLARAGAVHAATLGRLMAHPYFDRPPPKSLDRGDFVLDAAAPLSSEDGAATLTAFTAAAAARAAAFFPAPARRWLVCGGGRRNPVLMDALRAALGVPVETVEAAGWNGDALEAQAFAFLAVRALCGLPLSLPTTTGVGRPTTGGVVHRP